MRVCFVNAEDLQVHHKPEVMTFPHVSTERAELENFAHAIEQKHARSRSREGTRSTARRCWKRC
jgi:hypothetical protein